MKTKNIFKTLAFALLMPAILLTSACSNLNENEEPVKKGYTLPVTVNVTRQGEDPATKAKYNESDKTLSFSAGDKLFVRGSQASAGAFAGTLTWQSGGTFSGTISTEKGYAGTADELFTAAAGMIQAILLPNGYETDDYIYFINHGYDYTTEFAYHNNKAFALTKAAAVQQFSCEYASAYNSGFALSPQNAILNFTIKGLTPSTNVTATLAKGSSNLVTGSVTTDGSGIATFAMAITGDSRNINELTLTVGGKDITFTSSDNLLAKGTIYNITRNVAPALSAATTSDIGKLAGQDGKIYANKASATAAGTTAVAKIIYVGNETDASSPYTHGLALALADEGKMNWENARTTCSNKNSSLSVTDASWMLPSQAQWKTMITAADGYTALYNGFASVGGTNMQGVYWASTDDNCLDENRARITYEGRTDAATLKSNSVNVRACLAF